MRQSPQWRSVCSTSGTKCARHPQILPAFWCARPCFSLACARHAQSLASIPGSLRHSHNAHFCRKRTQNHLNDLEGRCEEKKSKIMQLQAQLRKGAAKPEGAPAAAQ